MRITRSDIMYDSAVVGQRKMDVRMRKRSPCDLIRDMVHLGGIGLEEFQPCGDIVKEVVNRRMGARGAATLLPRTGRLHHQR